MRVYINNTKSTFEIDEVHMHTSKNNAGRILKRQSIWVVGIFESHLAMWIELFEIVNNFNLKNFESMFNFVIEAIKMEYLLN